MDMSQLMAQQQQQQHMLHHNDQDLAWLADTFAAQHHHHMPPPPVTSPGKSGASPLSNPSPPRTHSSPFSNHSGSSQSPLYPSSQSPQEHIAPSISPPKNPRMALSPTHMQALQQHHNQQHRPMHLQPQQHALDDYSNLSCVAGLQTTHLNMYQQYPTPPSHHSHEFQLPQLGTTAAHHDYLTPSPDSPEQWSSSSPCSQSDWSVNSPQGHAVVKGQQTIKKESRGPSFI
jgi:Notch-like protein